ncbi:MAG TPA: hypothetical protein VFQ35_23820 [Polyangiaceae bacterium]|nr:hypothetical protein [Polyangiaceae bacterium]
MPRAAKRYAGNDPTLRRLVREKCLGEFKEHFARDWDEHWQLGPSLRSGGIAATEARAKQVVAKLRALIAEARQLTTWTPPSERPVDCAPPPTWARGGEAFAFLLEWRPPAFLLPQVPDPVTADRERAIKDGQLVPLLGPVERAFDASEPPPLPRDDRDRVVALWTSVNMWDGGSDGLLAPPELSFGKPARWLTIRELAIVTLLAGCWPAVRRLVTVAELIGCEEKFVRKALEKGFGTFWAGKRTQPEAADRVRSRERPTGSALTRHAAGRSTKRAAAARARRGHETNREDDQSGLQSRRSRPRKHTRARRR